MAVFVVSYDLRGDEKDYQSLYERLAEWRAVRVLESFWLIDWDTTATALRDDLAQFVDGDDGLFVIRARPQWAALKTKTGSVPFLQHSSRTWA